jgi:hypothetical protein
MAIVSSQILRTHTGSGRKFVVEEHTDDVGETYTYSYICNLSFDTAAELIINATRIWDNLLEIEKLQIRKRIEEDGEDPANITPKYATNTDKARAVARALMFGNPRLVLRAATYVSGFSDVQLGNFFTANQITRIRARQNFVLNNEAVFLADTREEL